VLGHINRQDKHITGLALALLYLGEGTKGQNETAMGSSDPLILKFFVTCLRSLYDVPEDKIRCEFHLRADQNPDTMMEYRAKELDLSKKNFNKDYLDKRTKGTETYSTYKVKVYV
jgi:hypothetical protein